MAKSKKNIDAFQQALLSNTKMIQSDKKQDKATTPKMVRKSISGANTDSSGMNIDPEIYKKLEEMGKKYQIDPLTLASQGLQLFISLEDYWFKE